MFRARGYHGTSLTDVTAAADATTGSLYHYFPDGKTALAVAAIRDSGKAYGELFDLIADATTDPVEAVGAFFDGAAEELERSDFIEICPPDSSTLEAVDVGIAGLEAEAAVEAVGSLAAGAAGEVDRTGAPFGGHDDGERLSVSPARLVLGHRCRAYRSVVLNDADEFVRLRTSEDPADHPRAAHAEASLETWLDIVERYPGMRFWVAQNKTIPIEILAILARDEDRRVRSMVAMKRKLEADLLELLAADADDAVRMSVARHRNTRYAVLERLAADDAWPEIRGVAQARL